MRDLSRSDLVRIDTAAVASRLFSIIHRNTLPQTEAGRRSEIFSLVDMPFY